MDDNKALSVYGSRDEIQELAKRLQNMAVGSSKLDGNQALALAQIATAHGLDPFNGEAWLIPGSGVMVGIKGLRKMARNQAAREGAAYWIDEARANPVEYNQPDAAVVYVCTIRDNVSMQAYGKSLNALTTAGVPYAEGVKMIGQPPAWVGIGVATPDERSKMNIHQRARKRAEADALKKRFDVDFASGGVIVNADADEIIEGQITGKSEQPRTAQRDEATIQAELGF